MFILILIVISGLYIIRKIIIINKRKQFILERAINPYGVEYLFKQPEIDAYKRGVSFLDQSDYLNAIREFSFAINSNPAFDEAYYNRGCAYLNLAIKQFNKKYYKASIRDFSETIKITPNFKEAYINCGTAYFNMHKYKKAIENFEESLRMDGSIEDDISVKRFLHIAYEKLNKKG